MPIPAGSDCGSAGEEADFPSDRGREEESDEAFGRMEEESLRWLRRRLDSERGRDSAGATSTLIEGPDDVPDDVSARSVDPSGSGSLAALGCGSFLDSAPVDVLEFGELGSRVLVFSAPGIFSARPDFCKRRAAFSASSPPSRGPT